MKKSTRLSCIVLLLLFNNNTGFSQGGVDTLPALVSAEVRWIDQFPSPKGKTVRQKKTIRDILSLVAGADNKRKLQLTKPMAVYAANPDDIWIVDQGSEALFRLTKNKAEVPRVFSRQKFIYQSLVGLCAIPEKGILFTDSRMNKIFFIGNDQKSVNVFFDSLILNQPTGIAFYAPTSEIWVVETAAHCITILDANGKKVRSFGKRGSGNGEFNFPTSIWIDEKGYAYIVDALNYRIQIFDQGGNFVNNFGSAGNASGYFASPKGIATDSYGDIYVVDALFHNVQIFDKKGHFLLSFGSQGREQGQFWMPTGIFIDKQDIIYVADSYNSRIQLFKLTSIVKQTQTRHD
jgi:DNA-binding beta-propeller fold protein YncE